MFCALCSHRDARWILRAWLQKQRRWFLFERSRECFNVHALGVDLNPNDIGANLFEQVEQWREGRVFNNHAVTETDHHLGDAVKGIHSSINDGEFFWHERPTMA